MLLGLLNVRFVTSEFDLNTPDLEYKGQVDETRLYENRKAMPRLWVEPDAESGELEIVPLDSIRWQPERIEADATGPGRVVLSEIDYPGWRVWVDGKPGLIEKYAGVLRSVKLGAGTHRVLFEFHPDTVYAGLAIGIFGWLILGLGWFWKRRQGS